MKTKSLKWHHVYYLLALFDIAAISMSLVLNHGVMGIYSDSVEQNRQWAQRLSQLSELSARAIEVNAPGNNVFDDRNVSFHKDLRDMALLKFGQSLASIKTEFSALDNRVLANDMLVLVDSIEHSMGLMNDSANRIFTEFSAGRHDAAGSMMATMDAHFADLLGSIGALNNEIQNNQGVYLSGQVEQASQLRNYEYIIAAAILLMVVAVTWYGHRIAMEIRKHEAKTREKTAELELQVELNFENERKTRAILEAVHDGIILFNEQQVVESVNRAALVHLGLGESDILGRSLIEILPESESLSAACNEQQRYQDGCSNLEVVDRISFSRQSSNDEKHLDLSISPFRYGGQSKFTGVLRNVTEETIKNRVIHEMAHTDMLTGIGNRTMLAIQLQKAIPDSFNANKLVALMLIDLDGFKYVNDTHGHPVGDSLLVEVARRLSSIFRGDDQVCRLGGDEFAIIIPNLAGKDTAQTLAERVITDIAQPFSVGGRDLHVGTSIGIAFAPVDDMMDDELLRKADLALYSAKGRGKGVYEVYDESLNEQLMCEQMVEQDLREAIASDQLRLHYQPQVDINSEKIIGVEALVRWEHPEKGLISPAEFIPIAERSTLIIDLGDWVLNRACRDWLDLQASGVGPLKLACNVSAKQFEDKQFLPKLEALLDVCAFPAHYLELELTETVAVKEFNTCKQTIEGLKLHGVTVAMDDFGTGYTSLNTLREISLDSIKIDRSLISRITEDETSAIIAQSLIDLGRQLNVAIVAEGAEDSVTIDALKAMRCDIVQGYYYYRPMPLAELEQALHEQGFKRVG